MNLFTYLKHQIFFKYLKYLLRHKWFVLIECFKMGLYWRGIVHDMSKFLPLEFIPYMRYFYGCYPDWSKMSGDFKLRYFGPTKQSVEKEFDYAWLYHQRTNKHHYQYWHLKEDSGKLKVLEMPEKYRKELLCDWKGAGIAQGKVSPKNDPWLEVRKWYIANKDSIILHPETQYKVEKFLELINDDCA